jgi:DNA invertase Pin-like site-specific DNA recombinase
MNKAWSYYRFSSKPQELGDSLRRQTELAENYAKKHNLDLDTRSYSDLGVSAFKGRNAVEGELAAFLKACDEGYVQPGDYLLVEAFDRLSRAPVSTALSLFQSIVSRGVILVTLQDNHQYSTESLNENWTSLIMALVKMSGAHEESEKRGKRIKEVWNEKRAKGKILTSICPAWLELNDAKNGWNFIPEKVLVVKQIFEWAFDGLGTPTIARKLNESETPRMGRAEQWEPALVMALLKNRATIGVLTGKKAKVSPDENYYPAVIDKDIFYAVQQNIQNRRGTGGPKGKKISNLFTGMFRCKCGAKMRYVSSKNDHMYLHCLRSYSNSGCDAHIINYGVFEQQFLEFLCFDRRIDLSLSREVLADPTISLKGEIADIERTLSNMMKAFDHAEAASMPTLVANMTRLEENLAGLKKKLANVVKPMPIQDAAIATRDLWAAASNAQGDVQVELRQRMQAALKKVLTSITFEKYIQDATGPKGEPYQYRRAGVRGPLIDALLKQGVEMGHPMSLDGTSFVLHTDGYLIFKIKLPPFGINGTRKRKSDPTSVEKVDSVSQ